MASKRNTVTKEPFSPFVSFHLPVFCVFLASLGICLIPWWISLGTDLSLVIINPSGGSTLASIISVLFLALIVQAREIYKVPPSKRHFLGPRVNVAMLYVVAFPSFFALALLVVNVSFNNPIKGWLAVSIVVSFVLLTLSTFVVLIELIQFSRFLDHATPKSDE